MEKSNECLTELEARKANLGRPNLTGLCCLHHPCLPACLYAGELDWGIARSYPKTWEAEAGRC